ncbi:ATP synthase F1 subunit epsilon [Peptococcaceae bacterium]|nr:ATP synthase F1 subunit epsilon [Peptococcaceae bacterium]
MAKTQQLDVVTPERLAFREEVEFVVAPGMDGEFGVLPGHIPMVSALDMGILRIYRGKEFLAIAITGGFLEVKDSHVIVLADTAERATGIEEEKRTRESLLPLKITSVDTYLPEIDLARAEEAKRRAEKQLASKKAEIDMIRAERALQRALLRIKAAKKPGSGS